MIRKERLVAILQKLVQVPSENPPGNEAKVAKIIEGVFLSSGLSVRKISFAENRPNVIGILKGKSSASPLLLVAHTDTVPAGSGWHENPFGGKIDGGKLYGRGATDDKCHVALLAELASSFSEENFQPSRDIIFLAMADEEAGGHAGLVPLLKEGVIRAKDAVMLDSSGFDINIAQKGLVHAKATVFGKKAHGAYPARGKNAIEISAKIILELKRRLVPCKKHPVLGPPTITIGTISGGERVNIVADRCTFEIDARFPPPVTTALMIEHLKKVINSKAKEYTLEVEDKMEPVHVDPSGPLPVALFSSMAEAGRKARVSGSSGATLMSALIEHKIMCVAVGFGTEGTEHAADEYVKIKDVFDGAKAMELFVKKWSSQ